MGSFFVLLSGAEHSSRARPLFHSALELALTFPGQSPSRVLETDDVSVASFARQNGSGSPIVTHPATGNWLVTVGTWFHQDGYASGHEMRLLKDFQKSGIRELASKLEGFFVVVVGDLQEGTVYLITDLVGSCHCFQRAVGDRVAISNSSLLLAALDSFQLDATACQEFLATGVIYEDRTLFQEVKKLAPASIYQFARGSLQSSQRYWQISDIEPDSLDSSRACAALWEVLADSAKKVEKAFRYPVCDLTGGYDSRALVAAFHGSAVPISTAVTGPADSRDVVISKSLARMADLPHLHLERRARLKFEQVQRALPLTDGEYDLVEYFGVQEVHQTLSEQFDISINGSFGELARGYWWELLVPHTGRRLRLQTDKVAASRYAVGAYDLSMFPEERRLNLAWHLGGVIERAIKGFSDWPNSLQLDQVYLSLRMQRWQGRIASSTNRIWPCLSPFMFRTVLEIILSTETRARRRSLLIRRMLAKFSPSWAGIPLESGAPCLPLTWNNTYRFLPLIGFYGGKVRNRMARRIGLGSPTSTSSQVEPLRKQLWSQEEVRSVLNPSAMCVNSLLVEDALSAFLRRSQEREFSFDGQWNRLLTLESALRVIEVARKRISDCTPLGKDRA
jgi:hypothetical protein